MTILQRRNRSSIWGIPVGIKDLLQLGDDGRVVGSKADTGRRVEVIPYKVACADMDSDITNSVLSVLDPGVAGVHVSCASSICIFGWSCRVVTRNLVVFDLHFACTVVVR